MSGHRFAPSPQDDSASVVYPREVPDKYSQSPTQLGNGLKRPRSPSPPSSPDPTPLSSPSHSRSPSPSIAAQEGPRDGDEYDAHWGLGAGEDEPVAAGLDTRLSKDSIGYKWLLKMGWVEGKGLGVDGRGRTDPVPISHKRDSMGVGKANQDFRVIAATVSQRKELDSERMSRETVEERKLREQEVDRKAAIKEELSGILKTYYCELCDKQYQLPSQYETHLTSYDHHHKKRLKEMLATQRSSSASQAAVEKRKEKERKREEKEMKRLAGAAGVALGGGLLPLSSASSSAKTVNEGGSRGTSTANAKSSGSGWKSVGGSGWSSVGSSRPTDTGASHDSKGGRGSPVPSQVTSRGGGWAVVGSHASTTSSRTVQAASNAPSTRHAPQGFQFGGVVTLNSSSDAARGGALIAGSGPHGVVGEGVKSGGWASIETPSSGNKPRFTANSEPSSLSPSIRLRPPAPSGPVPVPPMGDAPPPPPQGPPPAAPPTDPAPFPGGPSLGRSDGKQASKWGRGGWQAPGSWGR